MDVSPEAVAWLVQPISFLFVMQLMFSSMRSLAQNIDRALGMASKSRKLQRLEVDKDGPASHAPPPQTITGFSYSAAAPSSAPRRGGVLPSTAPTVRDAQTRGNTVLVLVLTEVSGMHVLATLLLMRMSIPEDYRSGITRAMGNMHFNFFHRWFDLIFLLAVMVSLVVTVFNATAHSRRIDTGLKESAGWGGWERMVEGGGGGGGAGAPGSPMVRKPTTNKWRPGAEGSPSPRAITIAMEE